MARKQHVSRIIGDVDRQAGEFGERAVDQSAAPSPLETAGYVRDVVIELRDLANDSDLAFLAFFLDMALEEANLQFMTLSTESSQAE